jgi:hypothetical protein
MAHNGRREAVALALAGGSNVRDAAGACGVGERTVFTWLKDPAFRDRVDAIRSDLFALAVGRLAGLSGQAAEVLGGLLASRSEAIRLQAARSILDYGPRLRDSVELARRIEELKRQLEGAGDEGGPVPRSGAADETGRAAEGEPNPGSAAG